MASAIPGRAERSVGRGEVFRRTAPDARASGAASAAPPVGLNEATHAAPGIDVCRLLVAAAGLSAGLVLPAALLMWAASNVLGGFGARVLSLLP
jgi:hypothetical protein